MGFGIAPENLIRDPSLSIGAKALWTALASHAAGSAGDQQVWPSQSTLAGYFGVTERSVYNWVQELATRKLVTITHEYTRNGASPAVYTLHFPPSEANRKPTGSQPEANRKNTSTWQNDGESAQAGESTSKRAKANRKPTGSQFPTEGTEVKQGKEGTESAQAPLPGFASEQKPETAINTGYNGRIENDSPTDQGVAKKAQGDALCTIEEAREYATTIGLAIVEAEKWWHRNESAGWVVGKVPMKKWRSAMQTWRLQSSQWAGEKAAAAPKHFEMPYINLNEEA